MTYLLLLIYSIFLYQLGSFAKMKRVNVIHGGYITPHGLLMVDSSAFLPVTCVWYFIPLCLEIAPRFLKAYSWVAILPGINIVLFLLLLVTGMAFIGALRQSEVQTTLDRVEHPPVAYEEKDYPSCLIGHAVQEKLIKVLKDPEISASVVDTPFTGIQEIAASDAARIRSRLPDIWVQPLHPSLGQFLADQYKDLSETAYTQADKAVEAIKTLETMQKEFEELKTSYAELKQTNESLNNKLLATRQKSRAASGEKPEDGTAATPIEPPKPADYNIMAMPELDGERKRLIEEIHKIDSARKAIAQKAAPETVRRRTPAQATT